MSKLILYYQTFIPLTPLFDNNALPTHIHISSIHFGKNEDNSSYIHLNDYHPNASIFNDMWSDIQKAHKLGVKIVLMVGGAGGAFQELFSNFDFNYQLLKNTIKTHPYISGIDLDIEENIDLNQIIKLVNKIKFDLGNDFSISFAPVAFAMQNNKPGLGGFLYKDLKNLIGYNINYFNTQFYYDFSIESYNEVIDNNYDSTKIILGMTENNTNQFDTVYELKNKYKNKFGGIFLWELSLIDNPVLWINKMIKILNIK